MRGDIAFISSYNSICFIFERKDYMTTARDAALKGVDIALGDAVAKLSSMYETCLIEAAGDAAKEAECKAIRDRSIGFAKRAYADMLQVVNQQWPPES
jgi:hypothetical protein